MVKRARNFRLEDSVLEQLKILAERWGVSQTQVLALLIREAYVKGRVLKTEPTAQVGEDT